MPAKRTYIARHRTTRAPLVHHCGGQLVEGTRAEVETHVANLQYATPGDYDIMPKDVEDSTVARTRSLIQRALGDLAVATADYESAWRNNTDHHRSSRERQRDDDRMARAHQQQTASRDCLIGLGIPAEQVHAIEAALVLAAAIPTGVRPAEHRDHLTTSAAAGRFIRETVRNGGIV